MEDHYKDSEPEGCIVIHPDLGAEKGCDRDPATRLDEAVGLAKAIHLRVIASETVRVVRASPSTMFGKGTVDRLRELIDAGEKDRDVSISVVVVNRTLSPVQQRNLERAWGCKVIDRNGLILEIFGARARTREGRLQVELAALSYQRSRLVRSWTHLERQRGGAGFMGGPGERQIETDRRLIDKRITRLKRELKNVKRTRQLHRRARQRVPYPIIALVGYTNAGKSTLFNTLTNAGVEVEDKLFATLDPTMRSLDLPSGRTVIISDTVGFISDLPHELVNAFHATLEEVCEADLIVHVRNAAHTDSESQKTDVLGVLKELGIDDEEGLIDVLNKIDLLGKNELDILNNRVERAKKSRMIAISALNGEGTDQLISIIDRRISKNFYSMNISVPAENGALLSWIYDHGEVTERHYDDNGFVMLTVRVNAANKARLERHREELNDSHVTHIN